MLIDSLIAVEDALSRPNQQGIKPLQHIVQSALWEIEAW